MTKPMKVKAFLIACILLATVVFSPLPTCTARELGGPGGYKPLPNKPPFNCGRGNRYCVRPAPKQRCSSLYKRLPYRVHSLGYRRLLSPVHLHCSRIGRERSPRCTRPRQSSIQLRFCLPLLVILSGVTKPSLTSKAFFLFVSCLVPEKFQGN
uniref:Uncharacterized protein n=1 Tax=Salix viminalis TaxID=40686 RepID=A0A6N2LN60_SALVM